MRKYNGKLILFGEYSMIFGSEALLIPYYSAFGEWSSVINRPSERGFESNASIRKFYDYLREHEEFRILDLRRFDMELNAGLFFDSTIPLGYGVGSSGALVAAIFDRYKLIEINDIPKLKDFLAKMESFFHGSSSGMDPLQCYLGKPFILSQQTTDNGQQSSFTMLDDDFISDDIHIFLIDTKIKSPTAPLVEKFKELRKDSSYLDKFDNEYVPIVSKCIKSLIDKRDDEFYEHLSQLSKLQLELLSHTIPEETRKFFLTDIKKDGFQVKLCGAGGGGFLLGFSNNIQKTNDFWKENKKNIIWVK
jgi:mevalonate kinase